MLQKELFLAEFGIKHAYLRVLLLTICLKLCYPGNTCAVRKAVIQYIKQTYRRGSRMTEPETMLPAKPHIDKLSNGIDSI